MTGKRDRFARTEVLLAPDVHARLEARAHAEQTSLGALVRDMLGASLEAREAGAKAVPPSKADLLLEAADHIVAELRNLASLVGSVGRSTIGSQYLLVHWAAREGGL